MRCLLCNGTSRESYAFVDYTILACVRCGFKYVDIQAESYPKNAQYIYDDRKSISVNPEQLHIKRRVRDILRYARPPGRALDIGCGMGEVAIQLSHQGFQATGIDMKETMISYLRQHYPDVEWKCLLASDLGSESSGYDLITMYHVLEHIPSPVEGLRQVKRLAAPGALIVIEVPNVSGWQAILEGKKWHYYKVDHINYFRPSDLLRIAEMLEMEVLDVRGYQHFSHPQGVWWKDFVKQSLASIGFKDVISVFLKI